jgi:hypothetical protein
MAKICPQCKRENPSAANICMFCGTKLLLEDERMSETDQLHAEIAEAKDKIAELRKQKKDLKKANADLLLSYDALKNEKAKKSTCDNETLKNEIAEKELKIKNLTSRLTAVKKKKGNAEWIGIFVLLTICFGIMAIYFYSKMEKYQSLYSSEIAKEITNNHRIKETISNLQSKINQKESENSNLKQQIDDLTPKTYRTRYADTYIYNKCGGKYEKSNCRYPSAGSTIIVFQQEDGYGLINTGGWIPMDNLQKQ